MHTLWLHVTCAEHCVDRFLTGFLDGRSWRLMRYVLSAIASARISLMTKPNPSKALPRKTRVSGDPTVDGHGNQATVSGQPAFGAGARCRCLFPYFSIHVHVYVIPFPPNPLSQPKWQCGPHGRFVPGLKPGRRHGEEDA